MKNSLMAMMIISTLFAAGNALAGTPDVDPTVAQLRERFQRASAPEKEELRLGSLWNCTGFSAAPGSASTASNRGLKLQEFDGMVRYNAGSGKDGKDGIPSYFTFQPQGLVAVVPDKDLPRGISYLVLRVDENGYMLGEWSVAPLSPAKASTNNKFARSAAMKNAYAISYELCVPY